MLLGMIPGPPAQGEGEPEERKQLGVLYVLLSAEDLAEVLKWPICVGEAQTMALAELEKQTGGKFDGDLWKFVEQAPSLGVTHLDRPPKRPEIEDAINELEKLRAGATDRTSVQDTNKPPTDEHSR